MKKKEEERYGQKKNIFRGGWTQMRLKEKKRRTGGKRHSMDMGKENKESVCMCVIKVHDSCLNPLGDNSWVCTTNTHSLTYPSLHFSLTISISLHPRPHLFFSSSSWTKVVVFPRPKTAFPMSTTASSQINILMKACEHSF